MESTKVRIEVLKLLPMFQQDVWRKLGLEHRQISLVVRKLEKDGLVKRKKDKHSFYLTLTPSGTEEQQKLVPDKTVNPVKKTAPVEEKKKPISFKPLLSNGIFSPCTGCTVIECEPPTCNALSAWLAV